MNDIDPTASSASGISADERQWAMFAHLSALIGFIIPFGNLLGPLIIWLMKKETSPFVDDQGKESLNFQITMLLASLVAGITVCIGVGLILLPVIPIINIVFCVLATIETNKGVAYRYPFALRLIK